MLNRSRFGYDGKLVTAIGAKREMRAVTLSFKIQLDSQKTTGVVYAAECENS